MSKVYDGDGTKQMWGGEKEESVNEMDVVGV